jgi:hypothetical protein
MISDMQFSLVESIQNFLGPRLASSASYDAPSRPKLALTVLSGCAFLCLTAYCALGALPVTIGGAKLIANQIDNTYPESTNIYSSVEAVRTGHLYASPSQPPYVSQPYGPLYYVINATIAEVSHLDFDLVRTRSRLLTYSCFLSSAVIIFLICRRLRFSAASSVLAALLFLGQPSFLLWNVTVRPDMLFLMMMLLSLLWAVKGDALGEAGYVFSGALAGLAFLIKPPGIAAPMAVLAILLYRRKLRTAAVFALSAGLPVVIVWGALLWGRGHFFEQVTAVGQCVWSIKEGAIFALDTLSNMTMAVPIVIGALGLAQAIRAADRASQMIAAFAVATWLVGFSGLPQLGSDVNYFLPGLAGCALLLPFAIQMIRPLHSKAYLAAIVLVLLWMTSQEVDRVRWVFSGASQPAERSYLPLEPFKILSDRPIFAVHGRDPDLLDPFTSHNLELAGHWDASPSIENVRHGAYDLIVLAGSGNWHVISNYRGVAYFNPVFVQAMNENYRVLCSTMTSAVLEPRGREVPITPAALGPALGQPCGIGLHGRVPDLIFPPNVR